MHIKFLETGIVYVKGMFRKTQKDEWKEVDNVFSSIENMWSYLLE